MPQIDVWITHRRRCVRTLLEPLIPKGMSKVRPTENTVEPVSEAILCTGGPECYPKGSMAFL